MGRINTQLDTLKADGRKALVPYIVCGDPHISITVPMMHALVASGADMIELGVPFSDPMAEGPTIQLAHERALRQGTSLRDTLAVVKEFRQSDNKTPVVLMGYINPIEAMGYQEFSRQAMAAGVDGLLPVDIPPEEAGPLIDALKTADINLIFLLSPTTTIARAEKICRFGNGFLYYVSFKGVTGADRLDIDSVVEKIDQLRTLTSMPLLVGFGIKDGQSAATVSAVADGVVVGSVLVNRVATLYEKSASDEQIIGEVSRIISEMRSAIDER